MKRNRGILLFLKGVIPSLRPPGGPGRSGRVAGLRAAMGMAVWVGLGLGLTGCAGFERDWRRAVTAGSAAGKPGGLEAVAAGAWSGRWVSGSNGHEGKLRCVVSGGDEGGEAAFRYHATWGVLSGTFPTRQPVRLERGGRVRSVGTWALPAWAGGAYAYDLTIEGHRFTGTWKCARDHGTFEMTRVEGESR